jgi:uncharacterized SAM-binding protein YcdF (DUF218 family)
VRSSPTVGLVVGGLAGIIGEELGLNATISFWGDSGPFVPVCAVVAAILWTTPLRRVVAMLTAGLALLWLLVCFTPVAELLGADLPRRDPPAPADAVFVAASSVHQNGDLTATSMSRLLHGLEVLASGDAPVLVLSDLDGPYPSYATAAKKLMEHFGIRRELEIIGPNHSTRDEAVNLARLCRERGWKRAIVVTAPYHSRRACAAVEHEGVEVVCSPSVETVFDVSDLTRSDERRRAFSSALHERIGLWLYARRGWIDAASADRQATARLTAGS